MQRTSNTYSANNRLERTRFYMGGYWTFLATGADTNGQFALMEMNLKKGFEPPAHQHLHEDESFHIIEGEITFTAEGKDHLLKTGDFIHFPKRVTHSFKLQSDQVKMLGHVTPAGLENFFIEISTPADKIGYPPIPTAPPSAELLQKIGALQQQYGIVGLDNNKIKAL